MREGTVLSLKYTKAPKKEFLTLSLSDRYHIIYLEDIKYVEGASNYTIVHTADKKLVASKTLKFYEDQLPKEQFMRIHRKYIVPIRQVEFISKSMQSLNVAGLDLPISRSNKTKIKSFFNL